MNAGLWSHKTSVLVSTSPGELGQNRSSLGVSIRYSKGNMGKHEISEGTFPIFSCMAMMNEVI